MLITTERVVGPADGSVQLVEKAAWSAPGLGALVFGAAVLSAGDVLSGFGAVEGGLVGVRPTVRPVVGVLLLSAAWLTFREPTAVVPGKVRVVQLFGRYHGTIRSSGLHRVKPFAERRRASTRVRNQGTALVKVKDAAEAIYAVDDFARQQVVNAGSLYQ